MLHTAPPALVPIFHPIGLPRSGPDSRSPRSPILPAGTPGSCTTRIHPRVFRSTLPALLAPACPSFRAPPCSSPPPRDNPAHSAALRQSAVQPRRLGSLPPPRPIPLLLVDGPPIVPYPASPPNPAHGKVLGPRLYPRRGPPARPLRVPHAPTTPGTPPSSIPRSPFPRPLFAPRLFHPAFPCGFFLIGPQRARQ